MSALTLQVASDLIAAHIGFVTGSIDREPAMQFRPLAKLPDPQRTDAQPSRAASPNPATNTNTAGAGPARQETDPFDRTWPQRAPMTEADGQQYEREEMQDGRFAVAD